MLARVVKKMRTAERRAGRGGQTVPGHLSHPLYHARPAYQTNPPAYSLFLSLLARQRFAGAALRAQRVNAVLLSLIERRTWPTRALRLPWRHSWRACSHFYQHRENRLLLSRAVSRRAHRRTVRVGRHGWCGKAGFFGKRVAHSPYGEAVSTFSRASTVTPKSRMVKIESHASIPSL